MEHYWNNNEREKLKYLEKKAVPVNPGLTNDRLVTKLSHGTAPSNMAETCKSGTYAAGVVNVIRYSGILVSEIHTINATFISCIFC